MRFCRTGCRTSAASTRLCRPTRENSASLLRLPPTQEITDEFRRGGFPHSGLLSDFSKLEQNLKQAAEHYFHPHEWFVTTYNKAKHGAPIIHDPKLTAGEFLLMAPQRDPDLEDHRYVFYKFGSGDEIVDHLLKLIASVSHWTQGLFPSRETSRRSACSTKRLEWAPMGTGTPRLEECRELRQQKTPPERGFLESG